MPFNNKQLEQLFKEINPSRVAKREGKFSYIETFDDIAHLIRLFGFEGWDHFTSVDLIFEEERINSTTGLGTGKWDVAYKGHTRIMVRDPAGNQVCIHDGVATGSGENQRRVEAHDLALKSAASDSLKRAAIHLGNQFGLSLYDGGSTKSVVGKSLAYPEASTAVPPISAEDVREQVAEVRDRMLGEKDTAPA
jgi:recombination DNA repair RAD52 pathway protein